MQDATLVYMKIEMQPLILAVPSTPILIIAELRWFQTDLNRGKQCSLLCKRLMCVAVFCMNVAVFNFFGRCRPHADDDHIEIQCFTSQRMVEIKGDNFVIHSRDDSFVCIVSFGISAVPAPCLRPGPYPQETCRVGVARHRPDLFAVCICRFDGNRLAVSDL